MTNLVADFQRALKLHEQGYLAEAEALYGAILVRKPRHADALHYLGMVRHQMGCSEAALKLLRQSLRIQPGNAPAHSNLGIVLQHLKEPSEALASYDRALALRPDLPSAWANRASVLHELHRFEDALASCDRALALRPAFPEAWLVRGMALQGVGRNEEALGSLDRALDLKRDCGDALLQRGRVLGALGRSAEALTSLDQAIALGPDSDQAWTSRAWNLRELGRAEEALASCDQALAIRPDSADTLRVRAETLFTVGRYEEALADCDKALVLAPDFAGALNMRGLVVRELGRLEEAIRCFEEARSLRPDSPEAPVNEAMVRLLLGDFDPGWKLYERRWEERQWMPDARGFTEPMWRGPDPPVGQSILLYSEQGLGDTLQFCRYGSLLAKLGARVVLEVQPALVTLLKSLPQVSQVLGRGDPLPSFDTYCSLMGLPAAFRTNLDNIPARSSYLSADPGRIAHWQVRLGPRTRPRVGLVWSGRTTHVNDLNRSLPLNLLATVLGMADVQWISLQKEVRTIDQPALAAHPEIQSFSAELTDLAETAALVSNLDLVITVDTAVAHLAGALGKPVWVLLSFIPDWRWLLGRNDSPWYPTARLFRQAHPGDWSGVLADIGQELRSWLVTLG